MEKMSLANLGGGAAIEKFDDQLKCVIENIRDPNTPIEKERSITLKVSFKPDENRSYGAIRIAVESKLQAPMPFITAAHFGGSEQGYIALEDNPTQFTFDDILRSKEAEAEFEKEGERLKNELDKAIRLSAVQGGEE